MVRWVVGLLLLADVSLADGLVVAAPAPVQVAVPFDKIFEGKAPLTVSDLPNGVSKLDLYPVAATVEQRASLSCSVDVANKQLLLTKESCPSLLKSLWRGSSLKLAVSQPGSAQYSTLELKSVQTFAGGTPITVTEKAKDLGWAKAIPEDLSLVGDKCWVHVDKWHELKCAGTSITGKSEDTIAAISAAWAAKEKLTLLLKVRDNLNSEGGWRGFDFQFEKAPKKQPDAQPLKNDLTTRCIAAASKRVSEDESFFAICADAHPKNHGLITLECKDTKTKKKGLDENRKCSDVGDLVRTNRSFSVYVWHPADVVATVKLSGTAGVSEGVYRPPGFGEKSLIEAPPPEEGPTPPDHEESFGPRRAGTADLSIVTANNATPPVGIKIDRTYQVEDYYWAALRIGVNFNSMPWGRKYGPRTSPNGQRYVDVIEGAESGLFSTALVLGATFFFCEVRNHSAQLAGGFGFRISVVGVNGSEIKPFEVALAGFELAFGLDFSIGIFGGVAYNALPTTGFKQGNALAPDAVIQTQPALTPAFSVGLTFTPEFMKLLGVKQ